MTIFLETSSYLPLIWRTPYSQSVIEYLSALSHAIEIVLQRDCIKEAAGYLSFEDNWKYHPAVRIRKIIKKFSNAELSKMPFPSTAVQILLGGNIWPQAQYLNFIRHTAFFFIDLIDGISFRHPLSGLEEFAIRIESRVLDFRKMFKDHLAASEIFLPQADILPYWGTWYLMNVPGPFRIQIMDDPRPYDMTADKLRDLYHYECVASTTPQPKEIFVANTGFIRNAKTSFVRLPVPIVCANTISKEIFEAEVD